jgi:hypothetical protein
MEILSGFCFSHFLLSLFFSFFLSLHIYPSFSCICTVIPFSLSLTLSLLQPTLLLIVSRVFTNVQRWNSRRLAATFYYLFLFLIFFFSRSLNTFARVFPFAVHTHTVRLFVYVCICMYIYIYTHAFYIDVVQYSIVVRTYKPYFPLKVFPFSSAQSTYTYVMRKEKIFTPYYSILFQTFRV